MNPTIMTARVSDQHLRLVNVPLIASGGVNVIQIRFEFCGLWTGCGKTAVFYRNPEEVYHVPIADGLATVPHEVLAEEGSFYIGVMGAASNIRTTEVVKVEVARGAITEATAEPEEPTPDIYEQLLAAYGVVDSALAVERARINSLAAMRSTDGAVVCTLNTLYGDNMLSTYEGTLTSNGADAHVSFKFKCKDFAGSEYWYKALPDEFTPMEDKSIPFLGKGGEYFVVTVQKVEGGGAQLCIFNYTESQIDPDITWQVSGDYPLASLSIPELADLRVGFDGVTYETAGEAIRGQFSVIESALDSIIAMQNELIGGGAE